MRHEAAECACAACSEGYCGMGLSDMQVSMLVDCDVQASMLVHCDTSISKRPREAAASALEAATCAIRFTGRSRVAAASALEAATCAIQCT